MFQVKICGITTVEDARLAAEAGADAIGLNFYEKSPRCVSFQVARQIVETLVFKDAAWSVRILGVTVNQGLTELLQISRASLISSQQLHGDETPELVAQICKLRDESSRLTASLPDGRKLAAAQGMIVRAIRCQDGDMSPLSNYLAACRQAGAMPNAVLLDAFQRDSYGGTGQKLDWNMVREQRDKLMGLPLILAGGLTPENVAEAIETARPDAVDVSSGVESSPGRKDPAKVRAFVVAAKKAFEGLDR